MTETVIRYTTAEPDYDYHFTRHMGVVGFDKRNRPVRKVYIERDRADYQCGRYASGNCLAVDQVEFAKQVEYGFIRPVAKTLEVDATLAGGALRGLAEAIATVAAQRADIDKERARLDRDDDYMRGVLEGQDSVLRTAAETLSTLHSVLTAAGV